jgi:hypothetical protein
MANLPVPSEELPKDIPNPRRQSARLYARAAVVLAPLTGVLAVLAGLSGAFALLGGVILPVGCALVFAYSYGALRARSDARAVDRQLEDFRRGRALAVWHCSAEEWRRFTEVAARILKEEVRLDWILAGIWAALGGVPGTVAGFVWFDVHGGVVGVIGIPLGLVGGVLFGLGFSFACDRLYGMGSSAARRRYRRALRGGGPTYFGRTGVYTCGEFHAWGDGWCQLRYVRLVEGDPSYLRLVLGRPVPSGQGGTIDVLEDVCVPVPAGHLAEARKVVGALGGSHEAPPKPRAGRPRY